MTVSQVEVLQLTDTRHFEDLISTLTTLEQQKEDCKWQIGDKLVEFLAPFEYRLRSEERTTFFAKVSHELGRSIDTMRWRYRTSQAFGEDTRVPDFTWDFHRMCASAGDDAHEWLDVSIEHGLLPKHLKKLLKSELNPQSASEKIEKGITAKIPLDKVIEDMTPPPQSVKTDARVMKLYGAYGDEYFALVPAFLAAHPFTLTDGEEVEIVIRRKVTVTIPEPV